MVAVKAHGEACDLECLGKGKGSDVTSGTVHEFVGPVKIVFVESTPGDHKRKVWGSALFTFVMLLLGATVFTVFFFTLRFKLPFSMNVHVLLCTMGFQLFMTTGIMMFSTLFGGSMYLQPSEMKYQHFLLEASGVFLGVLGTIFALGSMSFTLHAFSGFLAAVFSIVSSLVGPTVYARNPDLMFGEFNKKLHRNIALPTFILCTICFVQGLMKDSFIKWAPCQHLPHILILFTCIYSVTAVISIFLRLFYDC